MLSRVEIFENVVLVFSYGHLKTELFENDDVTRSNWTAIVFEMFRFRRLFSSSTWWRKANSRRKSCVTIAKGVRKYPWKSSHFVIGLFAFILFYLQILNLFLALLLSSFAGQASLTATQANPRNRVLTRLKKVVIASQFIKRITSKVFPKKNETSTEDGQEGECCQVSSLEATFR